MFPSNSRCDLHIHTNRSDGYFGPDAVLNKAANANLDVIALTDHDLPTHLATERVVLKGQPLWLLAAAEISVTQDDQEFHMLAYFPGKVPAEFIDFCRKQCQNRTIRYEVVRERLGPDIIPESDTSAAAGERALTRFHLARALVDSGQAQNIRDAFSTYLNIDNGYVRLVSPAATDTIRYIRSLGGFVSWAHPPTTALHRYLPLFVEAGLHGLEAYRPSCSKSDRKICQRLAHRHGLFLTGGSDWHGWSNPSDLGLFALTPHQLGGFFQALGLAN